MITGHTHCDIDRCFGVWKSMLFGGKKHSREHVGCLNEVVQFTKMDEKQRQTKRPKRFTWVNYEVAGWKSFLVNYFSPIVDITKYCTFEVREDGFYGCHNYSENFELVKGMVTPTAFPTEMKQIIRKLNGCGFKVLKQELLDEIEVFKLHLQSCEECTAFWDAIEKEGNDIYREMEANDTSVIQSDGNGNTVIDDPEDPDFVPEDERPTQITTRRYNTRSQANRTPSPVY